MLLNAVENISAETIRQFIKKNALVSVIIFILVFAMDTQSLHD